MGPTIVYAFMQSVGMVNDHETGCLRYEECRNLADEEHYFEVNGVIRNLCLFS